MHRERNDRSIKEQERDGRQEAVSMPTIWAGKGIDLPEPALELDHSVTGQSKQPSRTVFSAKGINLPEPALELDHSVAGHVLGLVVE